MNNRRQLKLRHSSWAQALTRLLVRTQITPNQISLLSIVFGVFSGLAFYIFSLHESAWLLLTAAAFVQLRLLCNLMDGLVAVEGGKHTKSGELYNDIPDRFSDWFSLLGAGYAISVVSWGLSLGWTAAILAILCAYVRFLGTTLGAPMSFRGPMAKQHRMATLTLCSILAAIEMWIFDSHWLLWLGLVVIVLGTALTIYLRTRDIHRYLESK